MKIITDHNSNVLLYKQIADQIRQAIIAGTLAKGEKIPSEEELIAMTEVSRGTVRKAIKLLVEEQFLEKIHGRGTFVSQEKLSYPVASRLVSFAESMGELEVSYETEVIEKKLVKANSKIASKLNIPHLTQVLYLKRVRYVDRKPALFLHNWINVSTCPTIEMIDFEKVSLLQAIEVNERVKIKYGIRDFSAVIADSEQARLLKVAEGSPLLEIQQITYGIDDSPIETSRVFLLTDKYQIRSILDR